MDKEAVFGNIKQNMNFKRFMLRGVNKVKVEIGLIAMAHNLKKYSLTRLAYFAFLCLRYCNLILKLSNKIKYIQKRKSPKITFETTSSFLSVSIIKNHWSSIHII